MKRKHIQILGAGQMMQSWAKRKIAVIVRDMRNRVIPFADGIGAEYWKGWNFKLSDTENLANNKAWVEGLKDQSFTIYDLRTGPKSNQQGAFYGMETKEIFGDK